MSSINVAFISSVPGSHKDAAMSQWGHMSLSRLLRSHVPSHVASWPVVVQCSSIGSLGQTPDAWLENELGRSLAGIKSGTLTPVRSPNVSLVYPSHSDVLASYDGLLGGGCLPYSKATAVKQPWLQDHFHNWRAEASDRTRAPPHIKTYTRPSPDSKSIAYFVLTSANLSKAVLVMGFFVIKLITKNNSRMKIKVYIVWININIYFLENPIAHYGFRRHGETSIKLATVASS